MKTTTSNIGFTVSVETQIENLFAPSKFDENNNEIKQKYLPCSDCGELQIVDLNTVSIICPDCWEYRSEEDVNYRENPCPYGMN